MKNQKGVTLVSLIITIIIILIITSATVYTSTNRFKINNISKMYNDIELLNDKIATYYLKFGGLPIIKNTENIPIKYTFSELNFDKNINDDDNYYIIDLEAIGNITLNYGKEGFTNQNASDDVYIINNKTHTVYYVKGIEYTDGKMYHSKGAENNSNEDTVPPTKPQINTVSGDKIYNVDDLNYKTNVTLEFVPGKDNWSGISRTTYSINNGEEKDISELDNNQYKINSDGRYSISVKTYNNRGIYTEETKEITVGIIEEVEYLESSGTQYLDMGTPYKPGMGFFMKAEQTTVLKEHYYYPFGVYDCTRGNNYSSTGELIGTRITGIGSYEGYGVVDYGKRIGLLKDGTTADTQSNYYINNSLCEGYCNYLNDGKIRVIINGTEKIFNIDLSTRTDNAETSVNMTMFGIHLLKKDGTDVPNQYTSNCIARIYEVKITMDNQIYAHYKACYDKEKGDGYMFDITNKKYCYNQGTGTFKTNLDE